AGTLRGATGHGSKMAYASRPDKPWRVSGPRGPLILDEVERLRRALSPHQRALAEERLQQAHREQRRLVAHVQRGIELHYIERAHQARVGDHLHAELRLAIGRPSRYHRADSGGDVRI